MSWTLRGYDKSKAEELQEKFSIGPITAQIVSRLSLSDDREVKRFLNPKLTHLSSPFSIPSMERAISRLKDAIQKQERVFVLGDYDVDGVTSTALFVNVLCELGLAVEYGVPNRTDDGVGLSLGIVQDKVLNCSADYDLVVALDCGSNDFESIDSLNKAGVDVIIIDHHQIRGDVHPGAILVNPHFEADEDRLTCILCSVALTFKLLQGLLIRLRSAGVPNADALSIKEFMDLVAMGTVTDLVPLVGENRILVSHGLNRIGKSRNHGLQALMDVCGLPFGKGMDVSDISFKLGPRINAGGRMADAMTSVSLLTSQRFGDCVKRAHELDSLNQDRQSTERHIYDQAISYLSRKSPRESVVLYDSNWHTGVVGIVASRIARQYDLPAVVLGSEGEFARGSVRSVESINIIKALDYCDAYLESWGGHPMAAGLSLRPENIERFRQAFTEAIALQSKSLPERTRVAEELKVDAWIQPSDITHGFMLELKQLGPFGVGNPDPILAMNGSQLASKVSRFGSDNFKFWVNLHGMDYDMMCLGWSFPSRIPENRYPLDLVFNLKWHEWKGRGYPQATLLDWKYSV